MSESFRFRRIEISRMRGLDAPFALDGLSPGINVVHGPNGAGKTSTAHALHALLWPEAAAGRHLAASAEAELGGDLWRFDLDGDRLLRQRNGRPAEPPPLPAEETRDRYRLSLHELLTTANERFAALIAREAQGGFDLAAAADTLGSRTAPRRRLSERSAFDEALAERDAARAEQEEASERARVLEELEIRLDEAVRAGVRCGLLEDALAHAEARVEAREAAERLKVYPAAMPDLRGDETERLRTTRERREALEAQVTALREEIAEAEARLRETDLQPGALTAEEVEELAVRAAEARRSEDEEDRLERELETAEARREEARRALGAADTEGLPELDAAAVDAATKLSREGIRLEMERAALADQIEHLEAGEEDTDPDRMRSGADLLRRWIMTGGPGELGSWQLALAAAIGLLSGGAVLTLLTRAALVLVGMGAVLLFLVLRSGRPGAGSREEIEREFAALDLPGPASWDEPHVRRALQRLEEGVARALDAERRRERREALERRLGRTDARWRDLESRREALAREHGVTVGGDDYAALWTLVRAVADWRECQRECVARAKELETHRARRRERFAELAVRLEGLGEKGLTDGHATERAAASLRVRRETAEHAWTSARRDKRALEHARTDLDRLADERAAILERIGLVPDDPEVEAEVRRLCERYDEYRSAAESAREAAARRAHLEARLLDHGPEGEAALSADRADLASELESVREQAAEERSLRDRCGEIRGVIRAAKRARALEEAAARLDRAAAALVDAREEDVRGLVTDALVGFVREAAHERQLPEVFRRARVLFGEITAHRYELRLDPEEERFSAFDTRDRWGRSLEELSSGTRVQLLLAVRVAFLDHEEPGAKLPIVLDEVLANSDDERALALMRATATLARTGRQVFYFTAQADEVEKWRRLLEEEEDVPAGFFDLLEIRTRGEARADRRLEIELPPPARVPSPAERSYGEYGAALAVPPPDVTAPAGGVHLWHVLDDPDALYALLERGVQTWGQLQSLLEHGGEGALPEGIDAAEVRARGKVVERVLDAARVGRGRPVDREVLRRSGAVSSSFIDAATDLCAELEGDAASLIAAIEEGRLKRFRTAQCEELRDWLEAHGYLDPRDPLDGRLILVRAMAVANGLEPDVVRGVVDRVLRGAGQA